MAAPVPIGEARSCSLQRVPIRLREHWRLAMLTANRRLEAVDRPCDKLGADRCKHESLEDSRDQGEAP